MLSPFSKQSTPVSDSPISGGGFSDDGRFSYGYWSICGKRMSMEDFMEAKILSLDGKTVGLFGVFDGHRGPKAAEYVKKYLFDNLTSHPKFGSDMKAAIAETYLRTDDDYLKTHTGQDAEAGSTASTAVLYGNQMFIANVGDSRAVISKGGKAVPVSLDHKPDLSDERERVEKAGGIVVWSGSWRVGGVLAVSRAFGNKSLKPYVVADPAIQEEIITDDLETLIIASDGLWDVVSNQVAVSLVKDISDPEEAARTLTSLASQQGSWDNITCIVVRFLHEKVEGSSAEEEKEP